LGTTDSRAGEPAPSSGPDRPRDSQNTPPAPSNSNTTTEIEVLVFKASSWHITGRLPACGA
jgi:hypothetical protein